MTTTNTMNAAARTLDPAGAWASAPNRELPTSPDVFLRLLVAQMRTQNPLEPQKGTEFVTQLAQFNTLEQLMAIRAELAALRRAAEASRNSTS